MEDKKTAGAVARPGIGKYSYLMLLGHATTDIAQGSLPAVIPFLIAEHGYSYAAAAGLVFAANALSAVTQPIFGWLGDRVARPWFMIAGILLAAVGISLVGFSQGYVACCLSVIVMGIGVSLFHPEGSKLANIAAGDVNKGAGMSVFSVGGNVGFTGGPIIVMLVIPFFGLRGTAVFLIPAIVVSLFLVPHLKDFKRLGEDFKRRVKVETKAGELPPDNVKGFTAVAVTTFFRAVMTTSLNTFVPLFWIGVFLVTVEEGDFVLAVYGAAGILATLAGGRLADRFGYMLIIRICCIGLPALLFFFVLNRTPALGVVLIMFVSLLLSTCNSPLMITGQGFMPNRIGMASGVLFGLTISMGGIVAPVIGQIGDVYGLEPAMFAIACFSIGSLVSVFFIPKRGEEPKKGGRHGL